MSRDKTHIEQVVRWANYVKNNPGWKKELKPFEKKAKGLLKGVLGDLDAEHHE